jgi:hypothetical protein
MLRVSSILTRLAPLCRQRYDRAMPLTLRRTGLTKPAAFAHLADYTVHDDGRAEPIGRIYEVYAPMRPELAWFWSIIVLGKAREHVTTQGNEPTLEE